MGLEVGFGVCVVAYRVQRLAARMSWTLVCLAISPREGLKGGLDFKFTQHDVFRANSSGWFQLGFR